MKQNIVVCLFGIVNRSITCTWERIKSNIIKHLEKNGFHVVVYVFNLICDNGLIDNANVHNKAHNMVPADIYESKLQSELDKDIDVYVNSVSHGISYVDWYTDNQIRNTMRQMYSEDRVGLFLRKRLSDYDYAIVCGPDYYLTQKVNIDDLNRSKSDRRVYVSDVNPGMNGYTNGYYMSNNILDVSRLLCRYESILPYLNGFEGDYEQLLKKYCDFHNIKTALTDQVFFKIRANKTIFWQGFNEKHKRNIHNQNEYAHVIRKYGLKPQTKFERK